MNQAQRNYLIRKIEESQKVRDEALKKSLPAPPNLNNYLLHAVMSNNFELIGIEALKELIRMKALNSKAGESNWMSSDRWGNNTKIEFQAKDIFVIPEEYTKLLEEYKKQYAEVEKERQELSLQSQGLITRITLASDKTLQKMINEVDDMGDISLMDTKIKFLSQ